MNFFKNTILTKRIVIFVLFIIVSLILWNTYVFFQKFKQEERAKMEILASAIKELATNTDLNASVNLETKIFENITNIPSIQVKPGDVVAIREKAKKQARITESLNLVGQMAAVTWVSVDAAKLEGTFKQVPDREDISGEINESLIVELYSR